MFEAVLRVGNYASLSLIEDWRLFILALRTSFNRTRGTSLGCSAEPALSRREGVCLSLILVVACLDFLSALNQVIIFTNFLEEFPSFSSGHQLLASSFCYYTPFVCLSWGFCETAECNMTTEPLKYQIPNSSTGHHSPHRVTTQGLFWGPP